MFDKRTDRDWERYGAHDPYYGVLTQTRYRREALTKERLDEFFASGELHVEEVVRSVRTHLDPGFAPRRALDFGCGVGRIVRPLARVVSDEVVGVDVSESMLAEARANCAALPPGKVSFVVSDDALSRVEGTFDFIHSFIVFQHIPVRRGMRLARELLARLEPGGVAALHFTYANRDGAAMGVVRRTLHWARARLPLLNRLFNRRHGRRADLPVIQMNHYDLNRLLRLVQDGGARTVHLALTDHAHELGALLYLRRTTPSTYGARHVCSKV